MKTFTIFVQFPDNFSEEEVLYDIANRLPLNSYKEVGIDVRVNNILAARYENYLKQIGLMSMAHPSKTKS